MRTLIESTRKTGHLGSKAKVVGRQSRLGETIDLTAMIVYQAHGYKPEDIMVAKIYYEDGMMLGPFTCVKKLTENGELLLTHIHRNGKEWAMRFSESH